MDLTENAGQLTDKQNNSRMAQINNKSSSIEAV